MHKLAYTINEAVEVSGIGRSKLYELIRGGSITTKKAGKRTLILVSDLEKMLNELPAGEVRQ